MSDGIASDVEFVAPLLTYRFGLQYCTKIHHSKQLAEHRIYSRGDRSHDERRQRV